MCVWSYLLLCKASVSVSTFSHQSFLDLITKHDSLLELCAGSIDMNGRIRGIQIDLPLQCNALLVKLCVANLPTLRSHSKCYLYSFSLFKPDQNKCLAKNVIKCVLSKSFSGEHASNVYASYMHRHKSHTKDLSFQFTHFCSKTFI